MFKWLRQFFSSQQQTEVVPEALVTFVLSVNEEDTLGCEDCYTLLDEYAELLMQGHDPHEVMPKVRSHLEACPCCGEELDALMVIAEQMAAAG